LIGSQLNDVAGEKKKAVSNDVETGLQDYGSNRLRLAN